MVPYRSLPSNFSHQNDDVRVQALWAWVTLLARWFMERRCCREEVNAVVAQTRSAPRTRLSTSREEMTTWLQARTVSVKSAREWHRSRLRYVQ